jgi:YegS/Rv2252/BmrU family lipid kinase
MTNTCKLIVNPVAGKGTALAKVPLIEGLFRDSSFRYEIAVTRGIGHAIEIAEESARKGYGSIVAVGGDGTANEVLNGLMAAKGTDRAVPPFGIIPAGRGNDFSFGVNVPRKIPDACKRILSGRTVPMDVGKVTGGFFTDGRFFGNGIGIGFDTMVGLEAAKMKHMHGFLAYVFGTIKTLFFCPESPTLEIEIDQAIMTHRSIQVSIMNGRRMGGAFHMAPSACFKDGLFDLVVTDNISRIDLLKIVAATTKGTPWSHPKVKTFQAGSMTIRAVHGSMVTHADGEIICLDGHELRVECIHRAIDVLTEDTGADRAV